MSLGHSSPSDNSPPSPRFSDGDESPYEPPKFGLELAPWGLEPIYAYEPGGFHPVHLGDVFGADGRYRVIHKLGKGGFATVWLCRDMATDTTTYKALKIVVSDASADHFPELCIGETIKALLDTGKNDDIPPSVPQYLVYPVDWTKVDLHHITSQPCVIDLGESFRVSTTPENIGTPRPCRSPELMLDKKAGIGSDLWALACTIFEIRTGRVLFSAFDNDDDSYLDDIVTVLGVLPEPWWSSTWGKRKDYYKDEGDGLGRVVPHREEPPLPPNVSIHPSVAQGARSLQDKLAPGVWYMDSGLPAEEWHRDIPQREIGVFADLLGRMLRYGPEDRMSAGEALNHEWFTI